MIIRGLRNFGKSIKYYFTPLGMLAIFFVLGLSVAITGVTGAVSSLFKELGATIGQSNINWIEAGGSLWNSITSLNWNISKLLSSEWITQALKDALGASGLTETIATASNQISFCAGKIIAMIVIFFVMILLGFIFGYALLYFQVRSGIIKDKWWKLLLYGLADAAVAAIIFLLMLLLVKLWLPFVFIAPILGLALSETISILGAYLIHAYKKVKIKEVFNAKIVALCNLSDCIIFISGVASIILMIVIFNPFVGFVIGLPLLEIALIVSRLSAESYVVDKLNGTYDKELEQRRKRKEKRLAKKAKKANAH